MALTTSLISFWELDEATGSGNRNDSHGTNHLTASGSLTRVSGVNGAFSVQLGPTDSLIHATSASLETGNIDWTIAGWVIFNAFVGYYYPLSKYSSTVNQREYEMWYNQDTDVLTHTTRKGDDSGFVDVASTVAIPSGDSSWHFFVIGHNITTQKILIKVDSETLQTADNPTGMHVGNGDFRLGFNAFDGQIDQVGFWKRVLTSTEITWLYNSGAGRSYAQIVAESTTQVLGAQILM